MLTVLATGNGNIDSDSLIAAGGPGTGNTPGFDNVGLSSTQNASVVYLGGGWVITAAHVTIANSVGPVRFGPLGYDIDESTITQILNTDGVPTDLKIFRLTTEPPLPSLLPDLVSSALPTGRQIMIGNGQNTGTEHFWHVDKTQSPWVWTDEPPPANPGPNDFAGFDLLTAHKVRWGENMVEQNNLTISGGGIETQGYLTQFDDLGYTQVQPLASEGQASNGDSGGAVFMQQNGKWVLGGIMDAVNNPRSGQPASTAVFGDLTFIVDLSRYRDQILAITSRVVARNLFYAGSSAWDVSSATMPGFSDDNAIATDKVAYLPGPNAANFANISSYSKGINGVMVDLFGTGAAITANDFLFRVGNDNTPSDWTPAPAPTTVLVRQGAGVSGSDRVELIWADGAIQKQWLEVIVKGNDAVGGFDTNTNLAASDAFFFGNAKGDTGGGDSASWATVTGIDMTLVQSHQAVQSANISIGNVYDMNRDGQVSGPDLTVVQTNQTTNSTGLLKILISAGAAFVLPPALVPLGGVASALSLSAGPPPPTDVRQWLALLPDPLEFEVSPIVVAAAPPPTVEPLTSTPEADTEPWEIDDELLDVLAGGSAAP